MDKRQRIKDYISRIREEIRYKNYAHAKEMCIRASNIDSSNLCIRYLREFVELHKKGNGRYQQLTLQELCAHLFRGRNYITAENWEGISDYISCLADEVSEKEQEILTREDVYFLSDSAMYVGGYIERLEQIVEQVQVGGRIINWLLKTLQNLKVKIEHVETCMREQAEEERKKKERERKINRWLIVIFVLFITIAIAIATCAGEMTW